MKMVTYHLSPFAPFVIGCIPDAINTPNDIIGNQAEKLKNGEISKDQYDHWRYTFPAEDTTQIWAKVPSKALSDALVEAMKDKLVD